MVITNEISFPLTVISDGTESQISSSSSLSLDLPKGSKLTLRYGQTHTVRGKLFNAYKISVPCDITVTGDVTVYRIDKKYGHHTEAYLPSFVNSGMLKPEYHMPRVNPLMRANSAELFKVALKNAAINTALYIIFELSLLSLILLALFVKYNFILAFCLFVFFILIALVTSVILEFTTPEALIGDKEPDILRRHRKALKRDIGAR